MTDVPAGTAPPNPWAPPGLLFTESPEPVPSGGTDGIAIASLVVALLGAGPLAVVLSLVALSRVRRTRRPGRGLALAALVLGTVETVVLLVVAAVLVLSAAGHGIDSTLRRASAGSATAGVLTDSSQLRLGDCLNLPPDDQATVSSVRVLPCSSPHDGEVYLVDALPEAGEFPGDAATGNEADDRCQAGYATFVGVAFADSSLDYDDFLPSRASWAQGDRAVTCVISDPDGQTTGTLRGSAR
jgi:hypothetical protein